MNSGELPTFILGVAAAIAGAAAITGGKGWRFQTPVAVVCAVLIVGAIVLAVTTTPWFTPTDDANADPANGAPTTTVTPTAASTTTETTTTTTTTVGETTEMTTTSVEPVSTLDRIPSSIASTCEPYTESQKTLVDGLVAQLTCTTPDGLTALYLQYIDAAAMNTAFVRHHGAIADESCADGSDHGKYSIDKVSRGEWACYTSVSGASVMIWTDSRYPVLGILRDTAMTVQGVSNWFFNNPVVLDE